MAYVDRKLPSPEPNPETVAIWDAAKQHKLALRKCSKCAKLNWYPRVICPFCFADASAIVHATGKGKIYTFSVMQRAATPYTIAYVTLEEGVTMMTNIVDCDFDTIRIGQDVELVWKDTADGGAPLPMFKPI